MARSCGAVIRALVRTIHMLPAIPAVYACSYGYQETAAPSFTTSYDSVAPNALLAYIDSLKFEEKDYAEFAGDEQRLMIGTCPHQCSYGPLVRIEPERGAYRNKMSKLQGTQGRIIGRMINNDSIGYPKYNLADRDTVYWVVSRVGPFTNDSAKGVSMYISVRGLRGTKDTVVKYDTVRVERHSHGYYPKRSLARWQWSEADETKWLGCSGSSCCK